ncbi:MAG: hypothetical protein CBD02_00705, partial [Candidatus Pelagibacter sp. TMED142]
LFGLPVDRLIMLLDIFFSFLFEFTWHCNQKRAGDVNIFFQKNDSSMDIGIFTITVYFERNHR